MGKVDPKEAFELFKEAIDRAVRERNIELLGGLIREPPGYQKVRAYLAHTIEALLTKRISFPNRKPKQNLEEQALAFAERVFRAKKEKGWKMRSVVDFVAKKSRCSPSTVWAAWTRLEPS